ncbi:hypothetical protein [Kitasatospora azatica]|uniref:hypothetical protein n=1 Tax=Kitasatospora azatica TaxID=58347 RepID=UPI00068EB792|nr:hypothetical protein [Kitasatospora azatica]
MLRHVTAPTRDFTQIANAHIWDDDLSDAAFRLLVRALALSDAAARKTTVTELAAGLTGGRITADRARRQLGKAGLLHCGKRRNATGQLRTESLVSNVPLQRAEAERILAQQEQHESADPPDAGDREDGPPVSRSSGTALPSGETLGENTSSPLPVPPPEPRDPHDPAEPTAERPLLSLRQLDARLVLGAAEAARLAPLAAEWLAAGVTPAGLRHALTAGLPPQVKCPAALLRYRLREKMPEPSTARTAELTACDGCERAFRPVMGEQRCRSCRTAAPQATSEPPIRAGWRERVRLVAAGG